MEDTIEICSGCGKMPRSIDTSNGYFLCTRCGNRATTHVNADDYEKVVTELDRSFHERLLREKQEAVKKEPLEGPITSHKRKAKKAKKKAKKSAKKKTAKKKKSRKKRK